ncbi:hypothetical protein KQX54_013957 [Cotesia glomerata]|uniref:Uncharacterized protein n=1 Tax=Cotesia glomerata TaxID=32391 RepID=A0AAV7IPY5_COTGL|nr:hypothetical protein KQX54_013957 [Cotesia glomerata]
MSLELKMARHPSSFFSIQLETRNKSENQRIKTTRCEDHQQQKVGKELDQDVIIKQQHHQNGREIAVK